MEMTNAEKCRKYRIKHGLMDATPKSKECENCGTIFIAQGYGSGLRKFCSKQCAAMHTERMKQEAALARASKVKTAICATCGKEFNLGYYDTRGKYCSKQCQRTAAKQTKGICEHCGIEFMGLKKAKYCSQKCSSTVNGLKALEATREKREKTKAAKEQKEADFRKALCLGLRMWRAGRTSEDISTATGYKSVSGFLRNSKPYQRITKKRMEASAWKAKEIEYNAKSSLFKSEEQFREYAAKELDKHFPCVMQEVQIPGSRRKIDLVVEDGLFRFGIELKNGNRTARMDQALGQAMIKCTFLGGLVPVVAVPDDIQIDALFLKASVKLGVIAGTLSQVIQQISIKCCASKTYSPAKVL